jgi:hypothetical protein
MFLGNSVLGEYIQNLIRFYLDILLLSEKHDEILRHQQNEMVIQKYFQNGNQAKDIHLKECGFSF